MNRFAPVTIPASAVDDRGLIEFNLTPAEQSKAAQYWVALDRERRRINRLADARLAARALRELGE